MDYTDQNIAAQLSLGNLEVDLRADGRISAAWQEGEPASEAAFKSFCENKKQETQRAIEGLGQVLLFVHSLFQIRATEKEKDSLHAQKRTQLRRIKQAAQRWWEWVNVASLAPHTFPAEGGYQLPAAQWEAISSGAYPWQAEQVGAAAGDCLHSY